MSVNPTAERTQSMSEPSSSENQAISKPYM